MKTIKLIGMVFVLLMTMTSVFASGYYAVHDGSDWVTGAEEFDSAIELLDVLQERYTVYYFTESSFGFVSFDGRSDEVKD